MIKLQMEASSELEDGTKPYLLISIFNSGGGEDGGDGMEHQSDNAQQIERISIDDSFEIFKVEVLMAIDKIKGKKKLADVVTIHNFIVQADATDIDKNPIKDFATH